VVVRKPNILKWLKDLLRAFGVKFPGDGAQPAPVPPVEPAPVPVPVPVPTPPPAPVPVLPALHVEGRNFVTVTGQRFDWIGLTAFRLLHMIASGEEAAAVALLEWARDHGITIVRVLTTAVHLFDLSPEDGRKALPRLLALANARGLYVEVVAIADSADRAYDVEAHVRSIGQIVSAASNAVVELVNEIGHVTQLSSLKDAAYLLTLRRLIPASVPVSLGSTHAAEDESDAYNGGDYITVHSDRADGDGGWRAVRHVKDSCGDKSRRTNKPVVSDEPAKELDCAKQWASGIQARINSIGATFHYQDGLQGLPPTGDAIMAYAAWQTGLSLVPHGGSFQNSGWADSPVKGADFEKVVRVYSSVCGDTAYLLLIGVTGEPRLELRDGWGQVASVRYGAAQLWTVRR
jgi:hypothetical protein